MNYMRYIPLLLSSNSKKLLEAINLNLQKFNHILLPTNIICPVRSEELQSYCVTITNLSSKICSINKTVGTNYTYLHGWFRMLTDLCHSSFR